MVEHADLSQTQASGPAQDDHVAECLKAITDYRGKQINKWAAIAQISVAISSAVASTNGEQQAAAGATYLEMLDEHDRILANAHSRGRRGVERNDSDDGEPRENFAAEDRVGRSLSRSKSTTSK